MTEHDYRISVWRNVFFRHKRAALCSRHAEHVEVVSGNDFTPDLFDFVRTADFELADAVRGEPGEDLFAFTKVDVTRIGRGVIRVVGIRSEEHTSELQSQSNL